MFKLIPSTFFLYSCSNLDCIKSEAEQKQQLEPPRTKRNCCLLATCITLSWLIIFGLVAVLLLHEYGPRDKCQTPNVHGYTFNNAKHQHPRWHDVREVDVQCARGFYGNATVTSCSKSWWLISLFQGPRPYGVSGCSESLCEPLGSLPNGMVAPDTEGKSVTNSLPCAAGVQLSASTQPYCNATCASGYRPLHTNTGLGEGHHGFVCPLSGGRATSTLRCVRRNFCAPLILGDGAATSGYLGSSSPPCFTGLELKIGQSCFVRCNESTHERAVAIRTCTEEGSAPTSRLRCTRKGHCVALELAAGMVGAIGATAPACTDGLVLRAKTTCAVKCDESGARGGVKYRPQRGEFRCPVDGGVATTSISCVKQVCIDCGCNHCKS